MAKNPPDVKDKADAPSREESAEEVVLRDESDEIIDNLKNQLENLQTQLDTYRAAERDPAAAAGSGGARDDELAAAWNVSLAPHIASRLQEPAEELTSRLERLIEQAGDPELRAELERCRELAYFFYETFQKISENHRLLTESLTAPATEVDVADFCRLLEHSLPASGTPLPVDKLPEVPRRITFASKSAATVIKSLVELAATLFGRELRIQVDDLPGSGDEARFLQFRIFSESAGAEAGEGEEVSAFAMRRGITANTVVDLLYVEKIVELQAGRFSFHRRQDKVFGFEVHLPYRPIGEKPS
jgi:hypothetical protein